MYIESLMQIGLTEKEASMYLMLLRIGPSPASLIAKRVGMKRVTAYSVLDSLCERGIVTYEQLKHGRRYIPHDPECLLYGVEKQFSEVKFRMKLAKTCVTKLQNVEGGFSKQKQKIIFHYGEVAIKKLLEDRIYGNEPLHSIFLSFGGDSSQFLTAFLKSFTEKFHGLLNLCVSRKRLEEVKKIFPSTICFGMDSEFPINGDLLIQGDRMIFIFGEDDEVQAMQLDDTSYSAFVRNVFLRPLFPKELS